MTPLIEKYIKPERIESIVKEKDFDKISDNEFIRFVDAVLEDDEKYGCDDEDHETGVFNYVLPYMDEFVSLRSKGFSDVWAKEFAYIKLNEDNYNPPSMAYYEVFKTNPEQASEDLKLYATLTKRDELFIKHFSYLLKIDVPGVKPSVEEQSIEYSKLFKEQINNGKSEIFADKYGELMARKQYSEYACSVEAIEYEKALLAGYPKEFCEIFADSISEYIVNYCSTYEESIDDDLVNIERERLEKKYAHLK